MLELPFHREGGNTKWLYYLVMNKMPPLPDFGFGLAYGMAEITVYNAYILSWYQTCL